MRSSKNNVVGAEFPIAAAVLLLVIIGGLVNRPSLFIRFQFDDISLVLDNAFLRGRSGLWELFKAGRPIRNITIFMDYFLWGYSPRGYHATNLTLHLLCGITWFRFVEDRFRNRWTAWWSAVVFLCHPLVTETLAVVTHRKEMLAFLFLILSLWSYLKASRPEETAITSLWAKVNKGFYALSFVCYILGLGSKQVVIVLPALAFFADYFDSNRPAVEILKKRGLWLAPFFAIPLALMAVSVGDWRVFGIMPKQEIFGGFHWSALKVSGWSVGAYMKILAWPIFLSADHQVKIPGLLSALFGAALWPLMFIGGLRIRKWNPGAGFGLIWIPLNLLMVLNLIPVNQPLAERYLYIPSAGFALFLVEFICAAIERESRLLRFIRLLGIAIIVAVLFNLSLQHMYNISINDDVKSLAVYLMDLAIFLGVLRLSSRKLSSKTTNFWRMTVISALTFVALISVSVPATVRLKQGEWKKPAFFNAERYDKFEYKYYHYKRGADVREFSGNKYVAFSIGLFVVICLTLGLVAAVLIASPWSGGNRMRQDLATVMGVILLYYSGLNLHRMNQWQTQGDIWTSTIRTDPTSQRAYVNYGVYLVRHKELDKAEWYYARAAQINPLNPTLWYNLGQLYLRMNDFEGAEYSFTQTLKLDPKNTSARLNLANIYVLANRQDDAINQYQTIVKIDPQNARAYYNIAVLLQNRGDLGGALDNCRKALALRPDFDKARDMCGSNAP